MRTIVFLGLMLVSLMGVGQTTTADSLYNPKEFKKVIYYQDSTIREVYNVDMQGRRHGKFYSFYSDGTLWGYGEFKHGKKHGEWVHYRVSGDKIGRHLYHKGERVGKWTIHDKYGNLVATKEY